MDAATSGNDTQRELVYKRMLKAVATTILLQFGLVLLTLALTTTLWPRETFEASLSPATWVYALALAALILLQGLSTSKRYLAEPSYPRTRFEKIRGLLAWSTFLFAGVYAILSALVVWLQLTLGYEGTRESGSCFVGDFYVLLLGGIWSSLSFFWKPNVDYLGFPVVPLSKWTRIKRALLSSLPGAMLGSVWSVLYFLLFRYTIGVYCHWVFFQPTEGSSVDVSGGLPSLGLVSRLWTQRLFFELCAENLLQTSRIFLTEWHRFQLDGPAGLLESLRESPVPAVRHLAFFDLWEVAQRDRTRRGQVFSLSNPGGHPYRWNCVARSCLETLRAFSERVEGCFRKEEATSILKVIDEVTQQPIYKYQMRNLMQQNQHQHPVETELAGPGRGGGGGEREEEGAYLARKWAAFKSYLVSKPVIGYLFAERVENRVRRALAEGQLVLWASESVSSLAVLSMREDPYGVVQKDLRRIVEALLALKASLDKLQKLFLGAKRAPGPEERHSRQTLLCLRSSVKRSIYRIVTGFKGYIDDLNLDVATTEQLRGFLSYKE